MTEKPGPSGSQTMVSVVVFHDYGCRVSEHLSWPRSLSLLMLLFLFVVTDNLLFLAVRYVRVQSVSGGSLDCYAALRRTQVYSSRRVSGKWMLLWLVVVDGGREQVVVAGDADCHRSLSGHTVLCGVHGRRHAILPVMEDRCQLRALIVQQCSRVV